MVYAQILGQRVYGKADVSALPCYACLYYICRVRNNVVEWNSHISLPETSMKIGKDGVLQYVVTLYPLTPPSLPGPVTWTCISAKRPMAENDSTRLAVFPLIWPASALLSNLPEFADTRSSERRYLLQDSKLNTFTTVVINIHLISGDPSYKVPQADQDVGDALLAGGTCHPPIPSRSRSAASWNEHYKAHYQG